MREGTHCRAVKRQSTHWMLVRFFLSVNESQGIEVPWLIDWDEAGAEGLKPPPKSDIFGGAGESLEGC